MQQNRWIPWETSLRVLGGARAQEAKDHKFRNMPRAARARAAWARARASEKLRATRFGTCRVPYHEALVRASGKDLAQGQVALPDPT